MVRGDSKATFNNASSELVNIVGHELHRNKNCLVVLEYTKTTD